MEAGAPSHMAEIIVWDLGCDSNGDFSPSMSMYITFKKRTIPSLFLPMETKKKQFFLNNTKST